LYLLTNQTTNILGIYELTIRNIAFDIGLNPDVIEKIINKFKKDKIKLEVKPWFNNLLKALFIGAWHPPVVMINNKIFSQGIVPNAKKFEIRIRKELKHNIIK
ncbi:MAG: hypothetical protein IIA45_13030, partial [Bacteroidetes bacterium]|nr:hypothetical protein [Bacteroidota bacterium]